MDPEVRAGKKCEVRAVRLLGDFRALAYWISDGDWIVAVSGELDIFVD